MLMDAGVQEEFRNSSKLYAAAKLLPPVRIIANQHGAFQFGTPRYVPKTRCIWEDWRLGLTMGSSCSVTSVYR